MKIKRSLDLVHLEILLFVGCKATNVNQQIQQISIKHFIKHVKYLYIHKTDFIRFTTGHEVFWTKTCA